MTAALPRDLASFAHEGQSHCSPAQIDTLFVLAQRHPFEAGFARIDGPLFKMIRRGKAEGWLQLPREAFLPWALLNEVTFNRTVPGVVAGRGGALLAKESLDADKDASPVLMTVPQDLILSLERVNEHAKVDKDFREVLESLGDFGRVSALLQSISLDFT